jgi:CMP-N-acetylneuraminic acid synthetase
MYKGARVLGVIPARGGSKSVPGKNIKAFGGKPLIAYTIEAARQSKYLTSFLVSTEDHHIADIAREYGAPVPFQRPAELAQDDSEGIKVIEHAIEFVRQTRRERYDYTMVLQPTSPLRTADDIDRSIEKIVNTGCDSVMSMVEVVDFAPKKLKRIDNDTIVPLFEDEGRTSAQRHSLPKVYKRNCAIYLTRTELILQGDLFGKVSRPYIMLPERSVDINTPADFELAEFYLTKLVASGAVDRE